MNLPRVESHPLHNWEFSMSEIILRRFLRPPEASPGSPICQIIDSILPKSFLYNGSDAKVREDSLDC